MQFDQRTHDVCRKLETFQLDDVPSTNSCLSCSAVLKVHGATWILSGSLSAKTSNFHVSSASQLRTQLRGWSVIVCDAWLNCIVMSFMPVFAEKAKKASVITSWDNVNDGISWMNPSPFCWNLSLGPRLYCTFRLFLLNVYFMVQYLLLPLQ